MRDRALRVVSAAPRCRTIACEFAAQGDRGFCSFCEAVYDAAQELREQLLARRRARVRARDPQLFDELAPPLRRRLLDHIAAQPNPLVRGVDHFVGLEDFLADLTEFGLLPADREVVA
jgi:hypothetical protein